MNTPRDAVASAGRVFLRHPTAQDREAFSQLVVASRSFLSRWAQGPTSDQDPDGTRWFEATLLADAGPRHEKLLVHRLQDECLLGAMNLNEIVRGSLQSGYLGYWIGAPHARQGYAREALEAMLEHCFEGLALHRVEANIQPGNEASKALVRGAGFRCEGFSPRYLLLGGAWRDHERWALTREDRRREARRSSQK